MADATTRVKVLKGSRLIDGAGREIPKRAVVVTENGVIREVGGEDEVRVPPGAEVEEFSGCTLMPGLMDCHLHLTAHNVLTFKNYRAAGGETSPQQMLLYALFHAQLCFEMGFTTLRHLGWVSGHGLDVDEMVALREAIDAGIVPGPRLRVAGWTVITGAHLDLCLPRRGFRTDRDQTADGPWELRRLARRHLRTGVDFLKTCVSGGGGTDKEEPDVRNMTQEELEAIVDEAHAFHKRVAVHCFTPEAQKMSLKAGADTIEHTVFTDDEALDLIASRGIPVTPTLMHRTDHAIEIRRRNGTPEFVTRKMKAIQPHAYACFQRMHRAGVTLALGTDTQLDPEMGANAGELELYVKLGMSPMEAILTGTRNAAKAIGVDAITGTLEPGKCADVIAVEGNPLADIRLLQDRERIKLVMKEGKIFVDRREGRRKEVIHDESRNWSQIDA
jgi:imidazolonepropionase-like amidohydrolase